MHQLSIKHKMFNFSRVFWLMLSLRVHVLRSVWIILSICPPQIREPVLFGQHLDPIMFNFLTLVITRNISYPEIEVLAEV